MSAVRFEQPTPEAIKFIADTMRRADAIEVMASSGMTPLEALESSVKASHFVVVVVIDDVPLTILGLVERDILSGAGVPWLLSSELALKHRKKFLELSPPVIDEMLQICPKLVNYVHSENTLSIRWLRWLGFTIEDSLPIGINGEQFHKFHREV